MTDPQKMIKLIDENLPSEINGYKRRFTQFKDSCNIIYCKDSQFMFKNTGIGMPKLSDPKYFEENVLYEVSSSSLEDCYNGMKDKLELNSRVVKDYRHNIRLYISPSFEYSAEDLKILLKLFEVYLVFDVELGIRFFAIVSINPLNELRHIVEVLNAQKKLLEQGKTIQFTTEDFDSSEFHTVKKIQFYSKDFQQKKPELRNMFKTTGWNVSFKDKFYFDKIDKQRQIKIILCEGENYKFLNNLKLDSIEFAKEHNSASIYQNILTDNRFAMRDKDYLIDEEVRRLKNKYPKYFILNYYCFENYLYHPDNIEELNLRNFKKLEYIDDIKKSKERDFLDIVSNFKSIRKGYRELNDNSISNVKDASEILISELNSDDFETFYKHYDMKEKYKKTFLNKLNLKENKLASTNWFKLKMIEIIS